MAQKAWADLAHTGLRAPAPATPAVAEHTQEVSATAISAPLLEGETTRATPHRIRVLVLAGGSGILLAGAWAGLRLALEQSSAIALGRWDFFARAPLWQQVSGYTALGCFGLAMALPLRRHLRWLPGRRDLWRVLHAALGLLLGLALLVHTSLRLGRGLNRVVSFAALALVVAGSLVAMFWRRSPPQPRYVGRGLRPLHTWLLWPTLGLIAAHVLVVYYY